MTQTKKRRPHGSSVALVTGCLLAGGCGPSPPLRGRPGDVIELKIKDRALRLEVASDDLSRRVGMMERKSVPENDGMIFVFHLTTIQAFWMKNTYVPLSIAFVDDNGKILQIEDMQPKDETNTLSKSPVRYAIEVNQGWFRKNGIVVGDTFAGFAEALRPFRGS